ncbi:MAG: histidine kinase [Bacteroidota bacterium]
MFPFFQDKAQTRYWLKVFALYALAEALVQLIFFFLFNTFNNSGGSYLEYHGVMWLFHCLLIWPLWWMAWSVRKQTILVQVLVNLAFFFVYSYCWFGPLQEAVAYLYNNLLDLTRPGNTVDGPTIDSHRHYSILNYQLLKHTFRLSWFYLANYFYNYKREEIRRIELAVSNRELQLRLLKWHLNPSFYFKTIHHLQKAAATQPANATEPILQLAKVMEYVIYEAREPLIEMRKEIQFLGNYIRLINQQEGSKVQLELEYGEGYEKLKIAPLLLTGLIDSIVAAAQPGNNNQCSIRLQFSGSLLHFSVSGAAAQPAAPPLLDELYRERYSADYSPEQGFNLSIQLDET